MMLSTLLFLLGCGVAEPTAPSGTTVDKAGTVPSLSAPAVDAAPLAAAPSKTHLGLTLGATTADEVKAWLVERSLTCPERPSPRRATTQVECKGDLPLELLPERTVKGKLYDLLIVRLDDGPVHHVSTTRRYSIPEDAGVDYAATVATLTAAFGPPTKAQPFDREKVNRALARFGTEWRFADLVISVSALKAAGDFVSVNERWDVPGVEASAEARAGSSGHSFTGPTAPTPAKNPHVIEESAAAAPQNDEGKQ
ncbi:MAG: hypothetical protein RIT28_5016 [Pseudomonadota bacterium]